MSVIRFPGPRGRAQGVPAPDFRTSHEDRHVDALLAFCYRNACHKQCIDAAIQRIIAEGSGIEGLEALARRLDGEARP